MEQENKELLLKDLCARSYYWPKITPKYGIKAHIYGIKNTNDGLFLVQEIEEGHDYNIVESIDEFKVYLRPLSSMTEDEEREFVAINESVKAYGSRGFYVILNTDAEDWLNEHHFDYRGLIEKGLALEAPEGMYKTK